VQADSYAHVRESAPSFAREQERKAFDTAIALMEEARAASGAPEKAVDAAQFMHRLWGILIKDLADPANELPAELRADLISIGLWVLRETDAILAGRSDNWAGVIDINRTVREGLAT